MRHVIEASVWQQITGAATSLSWGSFDRLDERHDLAISSGTEVKIYRNTGTNTLETPALYSSSFAAGKIILAQMNQKIINPLNQNDRFDLVSISGNVISIRLNNNVDGFGTPVNVAVQAFGTAAIRDIAIGDINNDDYNDVIVTSEGFNNPSLAVFVNNGSGLLNSSPVFLFTTGLALPVVAIADFGGPGGDGVHNDGWNDIVVATNCAGSILVNTRTSPFFSQTVAQTFPVACGSFDEAKQIKTADLQNNGGQSVIVATRGGGSFPNEWTSGALTLSKHTGNPAPAPPKNLSYTGAAGQHPTFTWAPNTERDISSYNIYRFDPTIGNNGLWVKLNSSPITTNSYTDNSVTLSGGGIPSHYEHYRVHAVDQQQLESLPSNQIDVLATGIPLEKTGAGSNSVPSIYALHQGYPNPFNPSTQINFDLPEDGYVSLNVFDVLGRKVGEIVNGNYTAGYHSATWNASGVASGVYFARFTATDANGVVKLSRVSKLLLNK